MRRGSQAAGGNAAPRMAHVVLFRAKIRWWVGAAQPRARHFPVEVPYACVCVKGGVCVCSVRSNRAGVGCRKWREVSCRFELHNRHAAGGVGGNVPL